MPELAVKSKKLNTCVQVCAKSV